MENKINIAELLKDCPKGMELDCTMYDNCTFDGIENVGYINIFVKTPSGIIRLTKEGCYIRHDDYAKCVIFPKGKTTWEGFHRPFKDGDVVVAEGDAAFQLFLLKYLTLSEEDNSYDGYCYFGWDFQCNKLFEKGNWGFNRLATEEEKQKLFDAIKANGYKWNAETKTLEKLPKFKVGDRVKHISAYTSGIVVKVSDKGYHIDYPKGESVCYINFTLEKDYELAPNKFDITTLKPFDKVLARQDNRVWECEFFSSYDSNERDFDKFHCVGGWYKECIPYEGNEHLRGTTNDCDDFYKTWEK